MRAALFLILWNGQPRAWCDDMKELALNTGSGIHVEGINSVRYEEGYLKKCLGEFKQNCLKEASGFNDTRIAQRMCSNHLDRPHVLARLLIPRPLAHASFFHGSELIGRDTWFRTTGSFPHYTSLGFKKIQGPQRLHGKLQKAFRANKHNMLPEDSSPATGRHCNNAFNNDDWVLPWGDYPDIRDTILEIREWLRPLLEEWSGVDLEPACIVYGIRTYHRGSVCSMHTDSDTTHIISAIYHVDQLGLEEPWHLTVNGHDGEYHKIVGEPRDIIFYESATVPHGRREPLNGTQFANIFFHFMPVGWQERRDMALRSPKYVMKPKEFEKFYWKILDGEKAAKKQLLPKITELHAGDACLPVDHRDGDGAIGSPLMFVPDERMGRRRKKSSSAAPKSRNNEASTFDMAPAYDILAASEESAVRILQFGWEPFLALAIGGGFLYVAYIRYKAYVMHSRCVRAACKTRLP